MSRVSTPALLFTLLGLFGLSSSASAINATWAGGTSNADWQDTAQWTPILGNGQQPGFDVGSGNRASFANPLDAATLGADTLSTTQLDIQREDVRIELEEGVTLNASRLDLSASASLTFGLATGASAATVKLVQLNPGAMSALTIEEGITLELSGTSFALAHLALTNQGTIVFDCATAGSTVTLTSGQRLNGDLRVLTDAGAGFTLDQLNGAALTLRGDGDMLINGNTELSGAVDKEGQGLLRMGAIPGDTTTLGGSMAIKGGDFSLPGNALFSGASISFVGAGDVEIGDSIFTGAIQSLTLDSSRDITGFIRVDDGAELTVNSTIVVAGPLYVGTGLSGDLELLGDATFEGDVSVARNGSVRARRPLVFERDMSVGEGATFVAEANARFTDPSFATTIAVDADVALLRFNSGVRVEGDLILSGVGGVQNGQPGTMQVDGDLFVAASISDANALGMDHALDLELAGDVVFEGVSSLALDDVNLRFAGPRPQSLRLASGSPAAGTIWTGAWQLDQSVTIASSLPAGTTLNIGGLTLAENVALDLSAFDTTISNAITFGDGASFAQSGALTGTSGTITLDASNADWLLDAELYVYGDLRITDGSAGNAVRVAPGATLTTLGSLSVLSGSFGAAEDGADQNGRAIIDVHGNLSVANGAQLLPGEGTWRLRASVDLSAGDDLVALPATDNDQAARIELYGGVIALAFSQGGSHFWIDQVQSITAIRQTGRMLLVGALNISASNATPAWDGSRNADATDDALVLGTRERGSSSAANQVIWPITLGAQGMILDRLEARAVNSGDADSYHAFRFAPSASLASTSLVPISARLLSLEGDTLSDDDAMVDDANAARIWMQRIELSLAEASQISAGANGNRGCWLRLDACALTLARDAQLSLSAAAGDADEAATLLLYDTPITMGRDSSLIADSASRLEIRALQSERVEVSGTQDWDYAIDAGSAGTTWFSRTNFRALGEGLANIRVGGAARVMDCAFWNPIREGLRVAGDTQLLALADNTFYGPLRVSGWTHLTFEAPGLAAGSITAAIGNRFVNTNASHVAENFTTNSRALVIGSLIDDFGNHENGTVLTSANTRVRDTAAQGNIIVLANVEGLGVTPQAQLQPHQLIAGGGVQNLLHFSAMGVGPNTINSISFRVRINSGDLAMEDFRDANGDPAFVLTDGSESVAFDSGGGISMTLAGEAQDFALTISGLNTALSGGTLTALPSLIDRTADFTLRSAIADFAGSTSFDVMLESITRAVDGSRVSGVGNVRNTGMLIVSAVLEFDQPEQGDEVATEPATPLTVLGVSVRNASTSQAQPISGTEISELRFGLEVSSIDPSFDPALAVNNLPGAGVFSLYLDVNGDGLPGVGESISATGVINPSLAAGGNRLHTLTFTMPSGALTIPAGGQADLLVLMGVANDSAGAWTAAANAELSMRLRLLADGVTQTHDATSISSVQGGALAVSSAVWGLEAIRGKGKVDDSCSLNGDSSSRALMILLALTVAMVMIRRRAERASIN